MCQALACWWRAHLQTNCGQRAFTSCDVAQETLWSEFDQHLTTASPRAAQWACRSSQLESDQQSSQLLSTSHQSGFALVELNAGTAGLEHPPISRPVLPILLNSSSSTGRPTRGLLRSHPPYPRVIRAPMRLYVRYCRLKTGSPGKLASTLPQQDTVDSRRTRVS